MLAGFILDRELLLGIKVGELFCFVIKVEPSSGQNATQCMQVRTPSMLPGGDRHQCYECIWCRSCSITIIAELGRSTSRGFHISYHRDSGIARFPTLPNSTASGHQEVVVQLVLPSPRTHSLTQLCWTLEEIKRIGAIATKCLGCVPLFLCTTPVTLVDQMACFSWMPRWKVVATASERAS